MLKLSKANFLRAKNFIFEHGEEIDRSVFQYHFEDLSAAAFLDSLSKYQYPNGGFGGLWHEFDYRGPCLKSTEIAVKYILGMKERPSYRLPIIQNTMEYLLEAYLPERGNWGEVVVPQVNDGIHCHWSRWRGEDNSPIADRVERVRNYDANEKACFAAFVSEYPELVTKDLYDEIIYYPVEHLLRHWDHRSPGYDAKLFDKDCPYPFEYLHNFVVHLKDSVLVKNLSEILCQQPRAFMELHYARSDTEYVHLPCDNINSPESVIYPAVKELVDESLDHRITQQAEDGRWPLGWSFGNDAAFRDLQLKYEVHLTLSMLLKLRAFNRLT